MDETTDSENCSAKENDEIDDLITLSGCDHITQWRFPQNQKRCPIHLCHEEFESRSAAISHYQEQHASHSILCDICNKPILLSVKFGIENPHNFYNHYKRMHPNMKIPYEFGVDTEKIEVQTVR